MGCLLTNTLYSKRFMFSIFTLSWQRLKESKKIWHSEMPLSAVLHVTLSAQHLPPAMQLLKSMR